MNIGVVDVYLALPTEKKFQGVGYYVQSKKECWKMHIRSPYISLWSLLHIQKSFFSHYD